MSHFLCGEIEFRDMKRMEESRYVDCLFRFVEIGARQRLYIQFRPNIGQEIVFDILRSQDVGNRANTLPFFITGSPTSSTSDEVFYPPLSKFSIGERTNHLSRKIEEVVLWVTAVFDVRDVTGMILYLSEGYDTHYDKKRCSLDQFSATIRQVLMPEMYVPSTKILVEPGLQ